MEQIPKIIHYCWFGKNDFNDIQLKTINSWKNHLSDYEFILWNEENSDMNHPFVKFAYERKKYAFVADYVRLKAVYEFGGIYMDTDMFLIKKLDSLLNDTFFIGAENEQLISAGIFGGVKKSEYLLECFKYYENAQIEEWQMKFGIPRVLTRAFESYTGIENPIFKKIVEEKQIVVYPPEYFYPLPFDVNKPFQKDFLKYASEKTIGIHLWDGSWIEYDVFQLIRRKEYLNAVKKTKFGRKPDLNFIVKIVKTVLKSIIS
ncbi:glycosyltransferase [Flavobacterium sp. DG2-3]|uniref:glycosyltransferase n=1 Tax=Flavobacterium sp. DG2-3 TaxID=3068317 RepID=UPI00273D3B73|nr:glycosyltransferase [Flavobacterium sp. DG2-3]MDP5200685.1 glycosyltransferase [Flavobacterium sp. DG2-3]